MNQAIKTNTCPADNLLNAYINKSISREGRASIEAHIAKCPKCLFRIAETYEVLNEANIINTKGAFMKFKDNINIWLVISAMMFFLSFIFPRYFLQFLSAAIIAGLKWIIDSKTTRMLIMIHEAWKDSKDQGTNPIESRIRK